MELLYLLDNTLGETCCLNQRAGILEYISLPNCCHGNVTANGAAVKLNRKIITQVDALVIPSALSA